MLWIVFWRNNYKLVFTCRLIVYTNLLKVDCERISYSLSSPLDIILMESIVTGHEEEAPTSAPLFTDEDHSGELSGTLFMYLYWVSNP